MRSWPTAIATSMAMARDRVVSRISIRTKARVKLTVRAWLGLGFVRALD